MVALLVLMALTALLITGVSMLVSPESYAGQRVVLALRRPLACRLAGLALILAALAGAAAGFIQFTLSHYSE